MNSILTIELTHVAETGEAVGRDEDGRAVFVADAIPGETVEVDITHESNRLQRGTLRRIVKTSPDRVEAPCPHFGLRHPVTSAEGRLLNSSWRRAGCSGCLWQHIDYERQLSMKREIIVRILAREANPGGTRKQSRQIAEDLVADVIALGANADEQSLAAPAVLDFGFLTQMRFDMAQSQQLSLAGRDREPVAIDTCLLHHPQLAELFAGFRNDWDEVESAEEDELAPQSEPITVQRVTLAAGGTSGSLSESAKGVLILHSESDDPPTLELDLPVNVFFLHEADDPTLELLVGDWSYGLQVEGHQLTAFPPLGDAARDRHLLADEVLSSVAAEVLELKTFEHLLDLWAGIGARATVLSERVATIVAVEEAELPAAALRVNLERLENADAWHGEMLPTIRKLRRGQYHFDAALLAPPGGHIEPELFSLLTRMRIRRCALITEEPGRLARALAALEEEGYRLAAVQPVDLQPHQPGSTLVARFDRK
ncbi:MAG: TRAM domain-containing protein [Caldilineaceae bacterium]|nr:TRAM domain-containing protein [Caldilineaceae bacterium]MDE0339530.1 TRAM domain-containing protein [Caldilineaceae bacterium]